MPCNRPTTTTLNAVYKFCINCLSTKYTPLYTKWRTSSHLNNSRHQKGNCAYMDKSIQCPQNSCRTYNNVKPSQNVCCFQKLNYSQHLQDLHCSLRIHAQELQVTPLTVHHIDNIFLWSLNSCPTDRKLFIT